MGLVAQQLPEPSGVDLVQPGFAEMLFLLVGVALLAVLLTALVRSAQREQWGWFFACLAFAPLAAPLYFLSGAAAGPPKIKQTF